MLIKGIMNTTNFEIIGERLITDTGVCDLWLYNHVNNFLVSFNLSIHINSNSEYSKLYALNRKVYNTANCMRNYYPEHTVYGLGVYKCLNQSRYDYPIVMIIKETPKEPIAHTRELNALRNVIYNVLLE